jgi:hypothetical protein
LVFDEETQGTELRARMNFSAIPEDEIDSDLEQELIEDDEEQEIAD